MPKVEIKSDAEDGFDDCDLEVEKITDQDEKLELITNNDAALSAIEEMRGEPSMNILWDFLRHLLNDDRFANFIKWTDR